MCRLEAGFPTVASKGDPGERGGVHITIWRINYKIVVYNTKKAKIRQYTKISLNASEPYHKPKQTFIKLKLTFTLSLYHENHLSRPPARATSRSFDLIRLKLHIHCTLVGWRDFKSRPPLNVLPALNFAPFYIHDDSLTFCGGMDNFFPSTHPSCLDSFPFVFSNTAACLAQYSPISSRLSPCVLSSSISPSHSAACAVAIIL